MATASAQSYPVTFDVQYSESLSRWMIFVKWLLAIPHFLILYALALFQRVIVLIALFAILFTKKFPKGLFDFWVGINRWSENVSSYIGLMRDEYPPFSMDAGKYPVTYDVAYPEELNRWMPLVKWILALPHYIVLIALALVAALMTVVAFFAILFTGKYPRGMFDFVVGVRRWGARVTAYVLLARDEYPPFSMQP